MKTMKEYSMEGVLNELVSIGFQEHSKHLETVKKHGKITSNSQLEAIKKTLAQVYEIYEIERGRGKSAVVRVGKPHDTIQKREDGRINSGQRDVLPHEKELMMAILKNLQSKKLKGVEQSLSRWASDLCFTPLFQSLRGIENKALVDKLEDFFCLSDTGAPFYNPERIVQEYLIQYNKQMRSLIERMFRWLQKYGYLKYEVKYIGTFDEVVFYIEEEQYKEYHELRATLIANSGYNYREFVTLEKDIEDSDKFGFELSEYQEAFQKVLVKVNGEIIEKLGFHFAYKTYVITELVTKQGIKPLSKEEMTKLYTDYFLRSTKRYRHKTRTNQNTIWHESTYFHQAFFYLSTTILSDCIDKVEELNFEHDLELYMRRYYIASQTGFQNETTDEAMKSPEVIKASKLWFDNVIEQRKMNKKFKEELATALSSKNKNKTLDI